mmetsp:Transcript_12068/g.44784  ORF Transcript_12068/g.44784 Transcript_12068/m.44784 type:complete len:255 (-) Transcript_12068:94-858(-)
MPRVKVSDGVRVAAQRSLHAAGAINAKGTLIPRDEGADLIRGPFFRAAVVEVGRDSRGGAGSPVPPVHQDLLTSRDDLRKTRIDVEDLGVVPGRNVAIEDLRQQAARHVQSLRAAGWEALDTVKDAHRSEKKRKVQHRAAGRRNCVIVLLRDWDISGAEVAVGREGSQRVLLAKELKLSCAASNRAVSDASFRNRPRVQKARRFPKQSRRVGRPASIQPVLRGVGHDGRHAEESEYRELHHSPHQQRVPAKHAF